jgi:glycosyltransferase involved in cell wall biosynthesis
MVIYPVFNVLLNLKGGSMSAQTEWIKRVIQLCMDEADTSEKKFAFAQLEKEYLTYTTEEQNKIRKIMKEQLERRDRIYILSAIIQNMKIDVFEEDILSEILEENYDCYTGSMMEVNAMHAIEGCYNKKRLLHKKNADRFDDALHINKEYCSVAERSKKRVVIITEQIMSINHAPTQVVVNFCYILKKYLHYEVMLFVCPTDAREKLSGLWYRPAFMNSLDSGNEPMQITYKGEVFWGYQINMTESDPKQYHMMMSLIHAWNPYFVFAIGVRNPVVDLIAKFTTLVVMELSVNCPISEAQILLRCSEKNEDVECENGQIHLFIEEKMPVLTEISQKKYSRKELGLPEDKFLIAIVGNRLDKEIDADFVGVMRTIIEKVPDIAFVLIGTVEVIKEYFRQTSFDKHIYYLGYRHDLIGTYDALDLYLNPDRRGGGFSASMALMAGLPVVTLPDCDVAMNVDKDFVVQGYEEMIETVCKYTKDKCFYEEKKSRAQAVAENNSEDKLVEYVRNTINKIEETIGDIGG